jgi:hypothetical protein
MDVQHYLPHIYTFFYGSMLIRRRFSLSTLQYLKCSVQLESLRYRSNSTELKIS